MSQTVWVVFDPKPDGPPRGPVVIDYTGQVANPGEPVEVIASVAGRVPSGDDPGEGLLAQTSAWKPANRPTRKTGEPAASEAAPVAEEV